MAVLPIIRMGHPTLRQRAREVTPAEIGAPATHALIDDMRDTLAASGGIGLAAPQVDRSLRLAVIEIANPHSRYGEIPRIPFTVYINPVITVLDAAEDGFWEGCLSVPGMVGYVERPQHIRVDYLDTTGEPNRIELEGFAATVFQHEFDHLDGVLYVDRLKDPRLFSFDAEYNQYLDPSDDNVDA